MGRCGMRLFECDQDLDMAIDIGMALGDSDGDDINHMLMTDQADPAIVDKTRTALDSGIGDQLFRTFRAKELDGHEGKYRVILLGALMMRAGAKIRDDDFQHLRDLVPQIHCRSGLAPRPCDNPAQPPAALLLAACLYFGGHGFR